MNNREDTLMTKTFERFLKQLLVWTVILPLLGLAAIQTAKRLDFQWLHDLSGTTYWRVRNLFTFLQSGVSMGILLALLWIIGTSVLIWRLLRRVFGYLHAVLKASGQLLDKNIEYIELPPELEEFQIRLNNLKRESEKNERLAKEAEQRKNDLVVYLAHDLKTPLTSVIGYLTLLHEEKQISEKLQEKYLSISLEKAQRLEDLINEFFEITRFNLTNLTLEYSRVNLSRFLEQLVFEFQPMLSEKHLQCVLTTEPDVMIRCDVGKMQRVFDNLLRNAVNYSFEQDMIHIVVTQEPQRIVTQKPQNVGKKELQNTAAQEPQKIRISFINSGNTIPAEKLERIFEQFYRLDTARGSAGGNAGLGLAIARQIVELHHGTITARSENETIEFEVVLPVS